MADALIGLTGPVIPVCVFELSNISSAALCRVPIEALVWSCSIVRILEDGFTGFVEDADTFVAAGWMAVHQWASIMTSL